MITFRELSAAVAALLLFTQPIVAGAVVSDDFSSQNLNLTLWTPIDPVGDSSFSVAGGELSISVGGGVPHDVWTTGNQSARVMQPVDDADFEIETKFASVPSQQYQMQGILVEQDGGTFIRFDLYSDGAFVNVFSATFSGGIPTIRHSSATVVGGSNFLRMSRSGDQWTLAMSLDGANWNNVASYAFAMNVTSVGAFVGNAGPAPAYTGVIDYFFNTASPIVPEDGGVGGPDTTPPAIFADSATATSDTDILVSWSTDEPADGLVEYGLTTSYELGSVSSSVLETNHNIVIDNLTPDQTYQVRFTTTDAAGNSAVSTNYSVTTSALPVIDIWYGDNQTFGLIGDPQWQANVLGNVSDPDGISSLTYSLNSAAPQPLNLGPDGIRLTNAGDFNIELVIDDLAVGSNSVNIIATDNTGQQSSKNVLVNYAGPNIWPANYAIDWSVAADISDAAQVVDGKWILEGDAVRPVELGYDRIIALGDDSWENYEVTAEFTVHGLDPYCAQNPCAGDVSHVALVTRWSGHYYWGSLPHHGWYPMGTFTAFSWRGANTQFEMWRGTDGTIGAVDVSPSLPFGVPHKMKLRAETVSGAQQHSAKLWQADQPEPAGWNLVLNEPVSATTSGSALLVAHHADVSFGDVVVTSLTSPPNDTTPPVISNLQVTAITATQATVSWNTDEPATSVVEYGPTTSYENGSVSSGSLVTSHSIVLSNLTADTLYHYQARSTDAAGNEALSGDFTFTTGSGSGPPTNMVSDDFTGALNTAIWSINDPLGDSTVTSSGTQLEITVPQGSAHDLWTGSNHAPRVTQAVNDTDFEVEVKFDSAVSEQFQIQGLIVEQDADNLLRFDFYSDGSQTFAFSASFTNGTSTVRSDLPIAGGAPLYMRVNRTADLWTYSYSNDGIAWAEVVVFEHALAVSNVGVFAGNSDPAPAHTAVIDYFYVTGASASDADSIVHLPLDEGSGAVAFDASGMGNNGALIGGPVYEAGSGDGSAFSLRLDGSDDYIDLGVLDVTGPGLTLTTWFNADSFPGPSNDPRLISKASGTAANDHVFMLGTLRSGSSMRLRARLRIGGVTTTLVASSGDLSTGVWYHAALVYDGALLRLYLNGAQVGSTPLSGAVDVDPSIAVAVGSQPGGAGRFFDGRLDDARILQRALSGAELAAIVSGNQPPVAVDDGYATPEDTPLVIDPLAGVLANDSDAELDPLQALLVTDVTDGTLALNADGSFDYTPDPDFSGTDSFTYRANDGSVDSNLATVTLTVNPTNDAPTAFDDGYQTQPNTLLAVNTAAGVLANDSDVDLDPLQALLVTDVTDGTLVLNADGSFDYTPDLDFTGTDSFTYQADDGIIGSNTATVTITIDQPPVAVDDGYVTAEDTPLVIDALAGVLANDTDTNPPADLTAALVAGPGNGVLTNFAADGSFTYVPNAHFNGGDSFTYNAIDGVSGATAQATVTLTVSPVNDVPVAVDDGYQTPVNTNLVIDALAGVLANDSDVDLDPLQALLVTDVTDGTLVLNVDGSFDYTPDLDFTGDDSFTYQADDGTIGSNTATVTITVGSADADSIVHLPLDEGSGAVAFDASGMGNNGALIGGPVYEAGSGDGSAFSLRLDGSDDYIDLGVLDVTGPGLTLTTWFNADSFPGPSNDPRLISKASGTAANDHVFMLGTLRSGSSMRLRARLRIGGVTTTLVASSGDLSTGVWYHAALVYDGALLRLYLNGAQVGSTPLSGAVDVDPSIAVAVGSQPGGAGRFFDGRLDDARILQRALSGAELAAIVSGNQPPVAVDDGYATPEDTPLVIDPLAGVLANDSDAELDPLQALLVTDVTDGTLALNADGSFDYTPDPDFSGTDSFTYRANDGSVDSNLATVTLTVNPTNDAPTAFDDGYQTQPNTLLAVNTAAGVLANDSDVDLDPLQALLVTDVTDGTLVLNADGSFDYTPDLDFTGTDSFTYQADDGIIGSNTATVTITIDQPPVAVDDGYVTAEDTPLVIDALAGVLANDTDTNPPADLTAALVAGPGNGVLTNFAADGSFTYVPNAHFNGGDSFTYNAIDGVSGATAQATVTLTVSPVNDVPVAVDDGYQTPVNTNLVIDALAGVLANDSDVDLDPLQALLVTDVTDGTLVLNVDGSFDYTPDLDFTGDDSFTYQADDGTIGSNTATVTITVGSADADSIVHLPLDEGSGAVAFDASGMGNNGALIGGPVYEAGSGDGSAFSLRLDGSDDYIDLGVLDVTGPGLTLTTWFNADSFPGPSNDPRLISKASGTAANDHVFMLGTLRSGSAIRLRARLRIGGVTTTLVANSGDLSTGVWYHAALVYDGALLRLYLNGAQVGSTPLSGAVDVDPSIAVAVGSQPGGASRFFDGRLDDARILQRALSGAELAAIVGGSPPPTAVDDAYATVEDTPLVIDSLAGVLANDIDTDPPADLTAALVAGPGNGVLTNFAADGSFTYVPNAQFNGGDSFTYNAIDGVSGAAALATVTLTVSPANIKPQLVTGHIDFSEEIIDDEVDETHFVLAADFTGDGHLDIVATDFVDDMVFWYESDGLGGYTKRILDANLDGAYPAHVADVDQDGDIDVLAMGYEGDTLALYNNDGTGLFSRVDVDTVADGAHSVVTGDLDADGDIDLVTTNQDGNEVLWYENDGSENFTAFVIDNAAIGAKRSDLADIDNDGDQDVIAASFFDNEVAWYENDGSQNFTHHVIDAGAMGAYFVFPADLNADGNVDILSASQLDSTLAWYENDGLGNFTQHVLDEFAAGARTILASDIDGDGDLDALGASVDDDTVAWFRNDGTGSFTAHVVAGADGAYGIFPADLDNDGDIDVLSAARNANTVALHTQIRQHVVSTAVGGTLTVDEAQLLTHDPDDSAADLTYTIIDEPVFGSLFLNGVELFADSTFTQQDINDDQVTYQHNGGGTQTDSWSFTVTDNVANSAEALGGEFRVNIGNPVVELPLDEGSGTTANDVSGFGNHGTLINGAVFEAASGDGSASSVRFDGVDDYIDLGNLDAIGSGLTLGAWFNADSYPGAASDPRIISKASGDAANDHFFMLSTIQVGAAVRLRARVRVGGITTTLAASSGDLTIDDWRHAAATYDGERLILYLDGVVVGSIPLTGPVDVDPSVPVAVGSQPGGASNRFDGRLDDVRIYARALGPVEIAQLAAVNVSPGSPTNPGNFAAVTLSGPQANLYWDASSDDIGVIGYDVYRDGLLMATVVDTNWIDFGLVPGQTYTYDVVARDGDGNQSNAATAVVTAADPSSGSWWNPNWPYRVLVGIGSAEFQRDDNIAEADIDFTQLFAGLGESGAFDPTVLRCHEVDENGGILLADSPCQFDPGAGYDAQTQASGKLIFLASGITPTRSARYFHVYFDAVGGSGSAAPPPSPLVVVTDDVFDEGQSSFQITTPAGEYLYQKDAGGFSSLIDSQGNDWINYHPTGGSAGHFRGIPNLVYPEGHFHPGATTSVTTLASSGALKATIHSITSDGLWEATWEIYPRSAIMTVLAAAAPYWFLYEGTPGGALEPASDFSVRSSGESALLSSSWDGDLAPEEWVYFVDPALGRSLFLSHHEDDLAHDSYRPQDGLMTVFGFGRNNLTSLIQPGPGHFTIGLFDDTDFGTLSSAIDAFVQPLNVEVSTAVARP